jgi:hypothetical protein
MQIAPLPHAFRNHDRLSLVEGHETHRRAFAGSP